MKFAVLKAMDKPGQLSDTWKNITQASYSERPSAFVKDYEKLVRAIADLELMEQYIRKDVLQGDESASLLVTAMNKARDTVSLVAPLLALADQFLFDLKAIKR
jgi:hypothetical protein